MTVPSVHAAPVRCGFRPGSAADGHGIPASFSARAIRATDVPGQPLGEHPPHHVRRLRVGLQAVRPPAPGGVRLVRVRPGISQPVPVRRAAAQVPALLPRLDGHRGPHPDAGPGHLPLRRQPQHRHRLLVMLGREVDPAARLRHPQLDPVMLEQRRHQRVLAAVERPLVLPDHDRVPAPVRVGQRGDQRGGLRAPAPRHRPALPDVEELRHDPPVPADQRLGLLPLPRPRRHRILPVLRRHPPVEREPQAARAPGPWPADGPTPPPTPPGHPRPRPGQFPVSPRTLSSWWPPPQTNVTALTWRQAPQTV